jgi:eukaryotic-like serine/threonine-protein kinase
VTAPAEWSRIEAALDEILALPETEWPAAGARIAQGDAELLREINSLLACAGAADSFLDRPLTARIAAEHEDTGLAAGERIGAYRILALIGRGGMGEVYRAERADGQFEQQVALKLMQRDAAPHVARFHAERQILARLEHPGIARLHDGGLAGDGRPFMIMELIDGRPILEWCRERRSGVVQRLELFLAICDAVAYAHRNLVVHRDLKPANVMVTAAGDIKLLDFGVAKLVGQERDDQTRNAPLTPGYAAPEQLTLGDVTTATDVYALGMLLFELLSGARPWRLTELPLVAGLEKVLHEAPPPMSLIAEQQSDAPVPPAALRGDLDAIVAKALRKEPERRYETVAALQSDIARSLNHEPVHARSGARLYVMSRFARRNRLWIGSGALVALALIGGSVGVAWQARRAEHQAARAMAVKDFLVNVFRASDPRIASGKPRGQITAKELLDAGSKRIESQFTVDPELQIELLGAVAMVYRELGDLDRYAALQARELDLARAQGGDLHPAVTDILLNQADDAVLRGDYSAALKLVAQADPLIHEGGRDRSAARARWWLMRGQALVDDAAAQPQRDAALAKAVDLYAALAPRDPLYVSALTDFGNTYQNRLELAEAVQYYRRALEVAQSLPNRNDAELQTIYGNLGMALATSGDFAGADPIYAKVAQIAEATYGKRSRWYWNPAANYAYMVNLSGQRTRAMAMFDELMTYLPPETVPNYDAAVSRNKFGTALSAIGQPERAIPLLEWAERQYVQSTQNYFDLLVVRFSLGNAYDNAGRTEDARRTLAMVLEQRVKEGPPDYIPVLQVRERWGRFLLTQGDLEGAAAQFREVLSQARGRALAHVALAQAGVARVRLARRDAASAVQEARKAADLFDHVIGFRDVRMGPYIWCVYAQALLAAGDAVGARTWAQKAFDASVIYDAPESADIKQARDLVQAASASATR